VRRREQRPKSLTEEKNMTQAVISDTLGPPEIYVLKDIELGPLNPDAVRVAIKAAGISFVDVLTAAGGYHVKLPVPFIPGSEAAGEVTAAGIDVDQALIGQRVMFSSWGGVFATEIQLPAKMIKPIPDNMSFAEAAIFPVSYTTVYHALVQRGTLLAGETLLVLGAGGATGYAAVQIGKLLGARVIASASSPEKRALAHKGGADAVIDARSATWREDVKAANAGKPVDVVFDPVGGEATEPAFRSLAWKGRHLIVGFPAGIAALRTNLPLLKGASLIGVDIRQFGIYEPELAAANSAALMTHVAAGRLIPEIAHCYPLADFVTAMNAATKGERAGRLVLVMA
jgi:NADPH2:quinone reductase